jgi:Golgi phosphoprotein 3
LTVSAKNDLHLYEEIMLLALRDKEGTIVSGSHYQYAVGGAILAELLLAGRINVEQERKKKWVQMVNATPLGDPLIDEGLAKIRDAKKRAQLKTWVTRLVGLKNLKHRAAGQLCRCGILRAHQDKILLIFTRKVYPELNPRPEKRIIERLQKAIFAEAGNIDPRTVVLIALAHHTGLLKANFPKKELKSRKKRIEQIVSGDLVGKPR